MSDCIGANKFTTDNKESCIYTPKNCDWILSGTFNPNYEHGVSDTINDWSILRSDYCKLDPCPSLSWTLKEQIELDTFYVVQSAMVHSTLEWRAVWRW